MSRRFVTLLERSAEIRQLIEREESSAALSAADATQKTAAPAIRKPARTLREAVDRDGLGAEFQAEIRVQ